MVAGILPGNNITMTIKEYRASFIKEINKLGRIQTSTNSLYLGNEWTQQCFDKKIEAYRAAKVYCYNLTG